MSNDELDVERHAGIDMAPGGESFEWNPGADNGDPIPAFQSAYPRSPDPFGSGCGVGGSGD